jgi:nucleotide-binding universal stress UspA family protein
MIALKRILVATDFGEAADAALAYGRELARTFNAELQVVHVVENVLTRGFGAEGYVASYPELQQEIEDTADRQLTSLLSKEDRQRLFGKTVLLKSNAPAFTIVGYAKENDIDLIIMGTHGRGAIAHLLMGSVAERVVRTAPCPVLTVRHPEHEFVLPDALVAAAKA